MTPPPLRRLRHLPLRVRLVAGFAAAMLVLLTGAGAFVYWRVQYALDRELDTELRQATSTIAPLVGPDGVVSAPTSADATGASWQVLDPNGAVLDHGGSASSAGLVRTRRLDELRVEGSESRTWDIGSFLPVSDRPYRVRLTALTDGGPDGTATYLVAGVRRDQRDEALRELFAQLTLAGLGALAVASVVGYLLARATLRPVERYRRRAAEIARGADGLRLDVPTGRTDEVTRLGDTLNEMLIALETALERERSFVLDASHELRTPLTLLRSRIQLARRRARSVHEHERVLDELIIDVDRLTKLATQLLDLHGRSGDVEGECEATSVVAALLERRRLVRPAHASEVTVDLPAVPVTVAVSWHVLDRVVTNLLDNALTHGRPPVRLRVLAAEAYVVVEVVDAGPGMTPDLLYRATRRFTRAPEARSRPGSGLGLAIVEQLVAAVDGELRLCSSGHHHTTGAGRGHACVHTTEMTVTVIIPVRGGGR